MNKTFTIFSYQTNVKLFAQFISHLFEPRKKNFNFSKLYKRSNSRPHQGKRECARRRKQLTSGIIHNHICTTWYGN